MFKRILVAVDHSESTPRVIKAAAELATRFGASLSLLHAVEVPLPLTPATVFESGAVEETLREDTTKFLAELHQQFPTELTIRDIAASGRACDQIVAAARDWHADLVIVGDRNRRGLSRFLLGSTADAVLRRAPCPVFVIRAIEPVVSVSQQHVTDEKKPEAQSPMPAMDTSFVAESI
ncbi:universal stress protein [soil metagenome]